MARTVANDPLQKYKYKVNIPGLPSAMGFQKVSGLKRELGVVEYNESGYKSTHKLSGKEKVDDITLERGTFADKSLENLYKKALTDPDYRSTITISLCDKFGTVQRTWTLAEAWVKSWEGSDMDADSDDVAIEKITITFEYFID